MFFFWPFQQKKNSMIQNETRQHGSSIYIKIV